MHKRIIAYFMVLMLGLTWPSVSAMTTEEANSEPQPGEANELMRTGTPFNLNEEEPAGDGAEDRLPFSLSMKTSMTAPCLTGTVDLGRELSDDDADEIMAEVWVSTDGINFTKVYDSPDWDSWGKTVQRNCLLPTFAPLCDYLNGTIDSIYVYLVVHFSIDDSARQTETAVFTRPTAENSELSSMAADGITVEGAYPPTVYVLDRTTRPLTVYGQLHIAAMQQENEEDYISCLPASIPIQLDFYKQHNYQISKQIEYNVEWSTSPETLPDGTLCYTAVALTAPSGALSFEIGEKRYQLEMGEYPNVLAAYPRLYCTVHPVEKGTQSELLLFQEQAACGILATFPLKPTGARGFVVYTSIDNGENWSMAGYIDPTAYPIDAIPNQESYTVGILTGEAATGLTAAGNGGFMVRVQIMGGPLGNASRSGTISQDAVWPAGYTFFPPSDPSVGSSGEGNLGNTGTDNSGSIGGIRPGMGNDADSSFALPASSHPKDDPDSIDSAPGIEADSGSGTPNVIWREAAIMHITRSMTNEGGILFRLLQFFNRFVK